MKKFLALAPLVFLVTACEKTPTPPPPASTTVDTSVKIPPKYDCPPKQKGTQCQ